MMTWQSVYAFAAVASVLCATAHGFATQPGTCTAEQSAITMSNVVFGNGVLDGYRLIVPAESQKALSVNVTFVVRAAQRALGAVAVP